MSAVGDLVEQLIVAIRCDDDLITFRAVAACKLDQLMAERAELNARIVAMSERIDALDALQRLSVQR